MNDKQIGNYRVVREIGSGGMGVVYLGERSDGAFEKPVAIKISRPGSDDREVKRRLVREAWILSNLDHENICRFVDMGITPDGDIFLIMEYIEGIPIDRFCNERGLSVAGRLALFRQVCQAVDYAHRKPVIHLDLKPSNILVTNDGVVKLLDFGTAVSMDKKGGPVSEGGWMADYLTLEYASPELIRGKNISTLSDQYSLGVVLYEILTGHRPFNVVGKMSAEIYRIISEDAPPAPSRIIRETTEIVIKDGRRVVVTKDQVCRVRGATPPALERTLKGDLDQALLMSLRKEPERRYQSVESFAQDLERYLEKRPLIAKKDSFVYRFSKFARRQPFKLLAISFVIWGVMIAFLLTFRSPGKTETLIFKYLKYCQASSRYLSAVKMVIEREKTNGREIDQSLSKAVDEMKGENCR